MQKSKGKNSLSKDKSINKIKFKDVPYGGTIKEQHYKHNMLTDHLEKVNYI